MNISIIHSTKPCGVDYNTIKSWLSILETSFVIYLQKPYYKNYNKRLVKAPKLYFYDTGLVCYLLGIRDMKDIDLYYMKGELFENYVISEVLKNKLNKSQEGNLYYFRDNHGNEVDLIYMKDGILQAVEIKSSKTINSNFFKGLNYWNELSK